MKRSIVPEIINTNKIKIEDDNFVKINICEPSIAKFDFDSFKNPFIVVNIFESSRFEDIEIKRIEMDQIERLGYRLVTIDLTNTHNMRNYRGQKKAYSLRSRDEPLGGAIDNYRIPTDHCLEIDITNNRIRIKGKNSYPYVRNENASQWIQIKKDGKK